jgi:phospholipid transport system transporter-binding protein
VSVLARIADSGAFAADADRWLFTGALTLDDAALVFDAARAMPLPGSGVVDLSGLEHADSAALAVLLALKRRGRAEGRALNFVAVPEKLMSLAKVYGVEDLIVA